MNVMYDTAADTNISVKHFHQPGGCHYQNDGSEWRLSFGKRVRNCAVSQDIMFSLEFPWDESMLPNTLVNSVGSKWPHPESILCRSQSQTLLYPGHCRCFGFCLRFKPNHKMIDLQVPTEVVVGRSEKPGLYQAGLMRHSQQLSCPQSSLTSVYRASWAHVACKHSAKPARH